MTIEYFKELLKKGRGEAVIYLRATEEKLLFKEAVLQSALEDPRFDRQCEGYRGQYLLDLLKCFPDYESLLDGILQKYTENPNHPDINYYIGNMLDWEPLYHDRIHRAIKKLYTALYTILLRDPNEQNDVPDMPKEHYLHAARTYIHMDESVIAAVLQDLFTLLQAGTRIDSFDISEFILDAPRKQAKKNLQILSEKYGDMEIAGDVVKLVRERTERTEKRPKDKDNSIPKNWLECLDACESEKNLPEGWVRKVFMEASGEDFRRMAEMVEKEKNPVIRNTLIRWLSRSCPQFPFDHYPIDPTPLLEELEHSESFSLPPQGKSSVDLRWFANYVAKIRHPAVRAYALTRREKMTASNLIKDSTLFDMWMTNYLPQDADELTAHVKSIADAEVLHWGTFTLLHESPGINMPDELLYYLYENNPCSLCRGKALELIIAKNTSKPNEQSKKYIQECLWDCNMKTRSDALAEVNKALNT